MCIISVKLVVVSSLDVLIYADIQSISRYPIQKQQDLHFLDGKSPNLNLELIICGGSRNNHSAFWLNFVNTLRLGELEPVTWFLAGHQSHPFESLTSQFFIIFPDSGVTGWHWFHIFSELVPLNWYSIKPAKATRILTPKASKFMAFGDSTYYLIGTVNYKHFFIRLASDRVWQICPF